MDKVKSGIKTSEFWLALVGAIIPVLNQYLGMHLDTQTIITILTPIITYILSRTVVKGVKK